MLNEILTITCGIMLAEVIKTFLGTIARLINGESLDEPVTVLLKDPIVIEIKEDFSYPEK